MTRPYKEKGTRPGFTKPPAEERGPALIVWMQELYFEKKSTKVPEKKARSLLSIGKGEVR